MRRFLAVSYLIDQAFRFPKSQPHLRWLGTFPAATPLCALCGLPGRRERQPTSFSPAPGYPTQLPPTLLSPQNQLGRSPPRSIVSFPIPYSLISNSRLRSEQKLNLRRSESSPRGDTAEADEPWRGENQAAGEESARTRPFPLPLSQPMDPPRKGAGLRGQIATSLADGGGAPGESPLWGFPQDSPG